MQRVIFYSGLHRLKVFGYRRPAIGGWQWAF
jgi:hypothetical protein